MRNIMFEIDALLQNTLDEGVAKLDDDRVREDLMGLFTDIRSAVRERAPEKEKIIYEYAKLLQSDAELYSPQLAFEAGALLATNPQGNDDDPERAFMRYICRIGFDPRTKALHKDIACMYDEIRSLLGEASGLIGDFTEQYRKCYGSVSNHIDHFFNMGYEYIQEEIEAAS